MPYSIAVSLKLARVLDESAGMEQRAPNALFYRWLEAADPRLAAFVHDQAEPKPFTLSPLIADDEEHCRFRVTLLEDQYWQYLEQGMKKERSIRAGRRILAMNGEVPRDHRTYADLAQSSTMQWEVILQFDSPASFKMGEAHYPLPDPTLVFASYRARWNAFAPEQLKIDERWLEWVKSGVAVSRFGLQSQAVDFGKYQQIGCVGKVQYTVIDRGPESKEGRGPLNALADYAFFCGTGHKTTQGLGQTRRLSSRFDSQPHSDQEE